MRLELKDISNSEFELMHESVLRLLSEFGVLFEEEEAQALLIRAGNKLDDNGRIHLSEKFVESMLALVPKDGFMMYGRDESKTLNVAVDKIAFRPSTGTPFILDYETKNRRETTMDDARIMVTLVDALDGFDMVNSVVSPANAPGSAANLRRFINAHRYSQKPSDITVMTAREVEAIAKIAAAIRGDKDQLRQKPLTTIDVAMITPLRCTCEQTQALMECAKWGIPVEVLTSPAVGITGPVTLAGSAVVAMAEVIAALSLAYLIKPGLGIISTARISPINMRTAAYNYGTPELGMGSVVTAALSNRYNIPGNLYGFGTIAKLSGTQAMMEKMSSGLIIALAKPHMITGGGVLDNAMITSPEQLVIDNESIRFIKRIRKQITIDKDSLGMDAFIRNMSGEQVMLTEEHTVKYLRNGEVLDAGLGQWGSLKDWEEEGCPDLFERAHKKVEQILDSHSVEQFDNALEKEIDRIVDQSQL